MHVTLHPIALKGVVPINDPLPSAVSGDTRAQARILFKEGKLFNPCIEPEYVPCALDDQKDKHPGIDKMIVDDEVVLIFNKGPIHVRHPINHHERNAKACTDPHHESKEERQTD